jgi:hypothetical protein
VKRSSDTRIRREVVGQMLDYAANALLYWPIETLRAAFEHSCAKRGSTPEDELTGLLGPEADQEAFWQNAKTNLLAGRIRMIFVADQIPSELQRIVEFLNGQLAAAEVLAVELRQYRGGKQRTLVPRVLGQTAAAQQAKNPGRRTRQWDEDAFFDDLEKRRGPNEAQVARRILQRAVQTGHRIEYGTGLTTGSLNPKLDHSGRDYRAIGIYSSGKIELELGSLQRRPPFDSEEKRLELLSRINKLPGVDLSEETITRFPTIPLSTLLDESALKSFLATLDWFKDQVLAN